MGAALGAADPRLDPGIKTARPQVGVGVGSPEALRFAIAQGVDAENLASLLAHKGAVVQVHLEKAAHELPVSRSYQRPIDLSHVLIPVTPIPIARVAIEQKR